MSIDNIGTISAIGQAIQVVIGNVIDTSVRS